MPQPYDYTSAFAGVPDPSQALVQGLQQGNGIQQMQIQQAQQQAQMRQQAMQAQVINALISKQAPTADDYARATLVVPGLREHFKQSWDMHNADQQQSSLAEIGQVHAALTAGQPQFSVDILRNRAAALKNSNGDPQHIKAAEDMAATIEANPAFARSLTGMKLASIPGGDKVLANLGAIGQEDRAAAKAPIELRTAAAEATSKEAAAAVAPQVEAQKLETGAWGNANTRSQIEERSARLGLDKDKLTTETQLKITELQQKFGELPEYVAKDINAATTESIAAQQSAAKMHDLAGQIDAAASELGGGVTAKAGELWKKTFGSQNELTRIRSEYSRIVTPAAMAAYKQVASGSTSDKDIETAMVGVPKDTDSPERLASFLRGAAKLQVYGSVLNNAKAEWLGAVKSLGNAKSDIEVDGVKVPAGSTFKQFADQYVAKKAEALNGAAEIRSRGYMKYAAPGAGGSW